jgi:hypothetical protein
MLKYSRRRGAGICFVDLLCCHSEVCNCLFILTQRPNNRPPQRQISASSNRESSSGTIATDSRRLVWANAAALASRIHSRSQSTVSTRARDHNTINRQHRHLHRRILLPRTALTIAVLIHVLQHATQVFTRQIDFQRPANAC